MWSSIISRKRTRFNQLRRSSCSNGDFPKRSPGSLASLRWLRRPGFLNWSTALTGEELAAAIERMLGVNVLIVESEQKIFSAMIALKEGRSSFADALIGALGAKV